VNKKRCIVFCMVAATNGATSWDSGSHVICGWSVVSSLWIHEFTKHCTMSTGSPQFQCMCKSVADDLTTSYFQQDGVRCYM
jgi:hypothetical protein